MANNRSPKQTAASRDAARTDPRSASGDLTGGLSDSGFRSVVESAPTGFVAINREGVIELVNAQFENLFGYRRDELLGQPVEMLVPRRFRDNHPSHRMGFFADPPPVKWASVEI